MATLHLVEGPVGAGKTVFAIQLGHELRSPPLVLDDWMVTLFQSDRPEEGLWPWYAERKTRCMSQIWTVACGLLDAGHDAIVELGLLKQADRMRFYQCADRRGYDYCVHVLDVPRAERWKRVAARNIEQGETFSMVVSADVFNLASDMWELPSASECAAHDIRFITSEKPLTQ